jgi:uncharacterized membrane protein YfcA
VIADPWFYAAAVPAVVLAGIAKGGFGAGVAMAVPLMSLTVAPPQAAAIMLPILVAMDVMGVGIYRRTWHKANMRIVLPAALVGIAVGTATFRYTDATFTRLLIGAIALVFTLNWWLKRRAAPAPAAPLSALKGGFWGTLSGFTSFVAHAGGPPLNVYLLPQNLEKRLYVGTTVVFFFVVNIVKLFPYAWLGQFDSTNLTTSAVLLPLVPLGIGLGLWLQKRVSDKLFYALCYGLLALTGAKLIWDGVAGLIG